MKKSNYFWFCSLHLRRELRLPNWRGRAAFVARANRTLGTAVMLLIATCAPGCFGQVPEPVPYVGPSAVPMRVAIAGLAHGHVFGFFQQYLHSPLIRIVGIEEPDHAFALRVAKQYGIDDSLLYTNLDEMLAKTRPQAVLTYTDTYDHKMVVETCARHHVDVMMEKPLAVSYADAQAIQRAAEAGHIEVMVNYETTWYRSNREAYELLQQGAIGPLRKFVARDGHSGPKEIGVGPEFLAWLVDPKLNGAGALFDFGCYGADLLEWLTGNEQPVTVTAVTQHIKPEIYPRVDDEATIVVTYPKAQAIIEASWNWPFDVKDIQVYGKTGYVKTVARDRVLVRRSGEREAQEETPAAIPSPDDDELAYLSAVVLDHRKPEGPTSLATNMIVTEILDAARESAKTGQTIRIGATK
ncbi:MAG: Gfo/Idh/MocA family protein [Candidatus Acidiferrales bacterium]